jgi:hypothetical protein
VTRTNTASTPAATLMTDITQTGILEKCCKKAKLSPLAVKEMIEEQIGSKIICECEIFSDPKEIKRKRLEAALGVDFGEPRRRNLDVG